MFFLQGDQVRNIIKELKDKYGDKEAAVLIEAAQNIRDKQISRAIDILKVCPKKTNFNPSAIKSLMHLIFSILVKVFHV